MQYEIFYLVGMSKEASLDKIKKEVSEIVTLAGGVFEEKQVVEKRKMAYEIKHENRGFYVAQRFNLEDTTQVATITRNLGLYNELLRSMIVRTDELPELTSREEREKKAAHEVKNETKKPAAAPAPKVAEVKPVVAEKKIETPAEPTPAPEAPVEKKIDEEDIDKKLEEILNI